MGKRETMARSMPLVTAQELERMPDEDWRYELVEGRLIRMSPVGALHGAVTVRLLVLLAQHARTHNLGFVGTEVGFILATNPDTVRAPDVAFVRGDRIPRSGVPRGFWPGPPDLAVEVLSPDDRRADVDAKVREYLTGGVRLVWIVDAELRTVIAHPQSGAAVTLTEDAALDAGDVLSGFSCPVRDIFT
jgi:Uma2 family endonuclease